MLLSLFTELIEHIVRLAIPSEYSSATYLGRQDTLRAVCLVNRKMRNFAQPVLQEVVKVSEDSTVVGQDSEEKTVQLVKRLLDSQAVRGRVRVAPATWAGCRRVRYQAAALRDVRLHLFESDVAGLGPLPALTNLVLHECELKSSSLPRLPALTDLTWNNSPFCVDERPPALSSATIPTLRSLAFWMEGYEGHQGYWPLEIRLDAVSHLESLVLSEPLPDINCGDLQPAVLGESCFSSCIDRMSALLHQGFRRIRLYGGSDASDPSGIIASITSSLEDTALSEHVELLYLPTLCRPSDQQSPELSSALAAFLNLCASRKIEVDFEDTDESNGGSLTSPKFTRYARRLREKEEEKEEEERGKKEVE